MLHILLLFISIKCGDKLYNLYNLFVFVLIICFVFRIFIVRLQMMKCLT